MIHIVVGTEYLHATLSSQFPLVKDALDPTGKQPLVGVPIRSVGSRNELKHTTVFDVFKAFHEEATHRLSSDPAMIIEAQRQEILHLADEEYHLPDFECCEKDACNSLAIHGLFPHGRVIREEEPVPGFLPDFSIGARCYAFFGKSPVRHDLDGTIGRLWMQQRWSSKGGVGISKLECHLCDSLFDVYDRADARWKDLKQTLDKEVQATLKNSPNDIMQAIRMRALEVQFESQYGRAANDEYLVIDAIVDSFQGHRSLHRDNPDVPSVGNHRLLAASAIRQGLGKPVISSVFPIKIWECFKSPVKHFLLHAAEQVGAMSCPPLYPNLPSSVTMRDLCRAVNMAQADCGFNVADHMIPLRQLGLEAAVGRRLAQSFDRREQGLWAWDWAKTIDEYQAALYDRDIEKSLHLQSVFDLHPLHKRLLGIIEHVIIPAIKRKTRLQGGASSVFANAFTPRPSPTSQRGRSGPGMPPSTVLPLPPDAADRATVEADGNWLIIASQHTAGTPLGLAELLDEMVEAVSLSNEVNGLKIRLDPSQKDHSDLLVTLGDSAKVEAAWLTLYLGRIALGLRNAIEHSSERDPEQNGLAIDFPGYWSAERKHLRTNQKLPAFNWVTQVVADISWTPKSSLAAGRGLVLPNSKPPGAESFLMTVESLKRCLVLISLVLTGCKSHLKLTY